MKPAASPLFLFAAVAGCAVAADLADPPLAQLARWRSAGPEAIAAEPVVAPCPAAHPACSRLHALRAEACLGQALTARAPGAACPAGGASGEPSTIDARSSASTSGTMRSNSRVIASSTLRNCGVFRIASSSTAPRIRVASYFSVA